MKNSFLLFLFILSAKFNCQIINDSSQSKTSIYYDVKIIASSYNKQWLAFRPLYLVNNDTIVVKNTYSHTMPSLQLVGFKGNSFFIQDKAIILCDQKRARYQDLYSNLVVDYDSVKKVGNIASQGVYYILDDSNNLSVYNALSKRILVLSGVVDLIYNDDSEQLFVHQNNGGHSQFAMLVGTRFIQLYSTTKEIRAWEYLNKADKLLITEIDADKKAVIALGIHNKTVMRLPFDFGVDDDLTMSALANQSGILVKKIIKDPKIELAEVWYANKANLTEFDKKHQQRVVYYIWGFASNDFKPVPINDFSLIIPFNNPDFLIAFNPIDDNDRIDFYYDLDFSLFNIKTACFHKIDTLKQSEMLVSSDGKFLVYRNIKNQWLVFNTHTFTTQVIDAFQAKNPVLNSDNSWLFLETDNAILKYDLVRNQLSVFSSNVDNAQIVNTKKESLTTVSNYRIYNSTLISDSEILFKQTDNNSNLTSYSLWKNGMLRPLILPTSNKISDFIYDKHFNRIISVQENYSTSPYISVLDTKSKKDHILFNKPSKYLINRHVVNYLSVDNKPLKGVLYYPFGYDESKLYPMVVHIYERQFTKSNAYVYPGLGLRDPLGFDLVALLREGYFVFFPDIIPESIGAGLSALYCVNNALDAIKSVKTIDTTKIGLIGHSFGGYEVDFIATHSNRFAAYISGAGHSDIIRAYHSYNFNRPYAFQFESGIYNMPYPFHVNKQLYVENNPIYYADKLTAPILLWSGKNDRNVPWEHTLSFFMALKRYNKKAIALFFPGKNHDLGNATIESQELYIKMLDWWAYFLKDEKDKAWIKNMF